MKEIISENIRRNALLATSYDPVTGLGCIGTRIFTPPHGDIPQAYLPAEMLDDPQYAVATDLVSWQRLRCRHDFEYWAVTCVRIKDKVSGCEIPFRLNRPQRRVAAVLESQRIAGQPLRLIMLKARQWGGSTLVQMYMAWIQSVHRRGWHSLICAHVKDTAANIRGMYTRMLASYPDALWEGEEPPKFGAFERSVNTRLIAGRDCRVTVGSSENQEAVRGADYSMAHLSEVAFWSDTATRSPEGFIRAICGSVMRIPCSLIVMESTANGVGNFFHTEWLRASSGDGSDKTPVFVPWHEIEIYSEQVSDPAALWESMDGYEHALWEQGLTLEQICWYHNKRREYPSHATMMAEYPSTDVEAFANTGSSVFEASRVEHLRAGCRPPAMTGELKAAAQRGPGALRDIEFRHDTSGDLQVWSPPQTDGCVADRYVVTVDVGGRSASSDWSVIAVIDTLAPVPEVVAHWRGHIDHDLLAWKSATIAQWYCGALLVVESNTLETSDAYGVHGTYILGQLNSHYPNMYLRTVPDSAAGQTESRIGFHTNRATKTMAVNELIAAVRDSAYVERSHTACNEMITYRHTRSGGFEAAPGHHDDVLMTRAIALCVISYMPRRSDADVTPLLRPHPCLWNTG